MNLLHKITEIDKLHEKVDETHDLITKYLESQMKILRQLGLINQMMDEDNSDQDSEDLQFKLDKCIQPDDIIYTEFDDAHPIGIPAPAKIPKKKLKKSLPIEIPARPVDFDISIKPQSLSDSIKVMPSYDNNVKVISTKKAPKVVKKRGRPKKD